MQREIHYSELSEEDQEQYEEIFSDDISIEEDITPGAINSWLFNEDTIKKVLQTLMEKGLKVESNDKLGKTIIFAKNHKHAVRIQEIFDQLYPHYHGQFAAIIDNHINYASDLIDKFEQFDKMPQIAISVDMLDTGIDVPGVILNQYNDSDKCEVYLYIKLDNEIASPLLYNEYNDIVNATEKFNKMVNLVKSQNLDTIRDIIKKVYKKVSKK